jgi:hypothetical protein
MGWSGVGSRAGRLRALEAVRRPRRIEASMTRRRRDASFSVHFYPVCGRAGAQDLDIGITLAMLCASALPVVVQLTKACPVRSSLFAHPPTYRTYI